MNPQRLLQHFERIAEAPDAVPRLRRFILDLAVRGKLRPYLNKVLVADQAPRGLDRHRLATLACRSRLCSGRENSRDGAEPLEYHR